jgi:TolC family type I secretion outer membrane protein
MQYPNHYCLQTVLLLTLLVCLFSGPAAAQQDHQVPHAQLAITPEGEVNWNAIKVLDLSTAEQIALAGNPTIAVAEARLRQAEERISQARSTYWPRLDANAGTSRVWLSENEYQDSLSSAQVFNPLATIDDPSDHYRADLTLSWLVFNGFARSLNSKAASFSRDQFAYSREDTKRILLLSVASAYLAAQLALENIAITHADEKFYRDRFEEAKVRREIGTGSLSDQLNFEVRVNAAISDRIKAERVYESARYSLAALLGIAYASLPDHVSLAELHSETRDEMNHPDAVNMIAYAYEHRPDLLQQDVAVKRAEVGTKIAKSGFWPTINLTGSVAGNRDEDYYFEEDDFGNTVGIYLTYNLFAGGLDRAKTREARQKEVESIKALENKQLSVAADIRGSVADLRAAQEQLLLLRSNAELIRQNRDLTEKEYNAGQGSLVRLNEAQQDLTAAKNRLALALVSMRQAWYALEAETGRILEYF